MIQLKDCVGEYDIYLSRILIALRTPPLDGHVVVCNAEVSSTIDVNYATDDYIVLQIVQNVYFMIRAYKG